MDITLKIIYSKLLSLLYFVYPIIVAVLLVFLVQHFIIRPSVVVGLSMYPTFNEKPSILHPIVVGDYIFVERVSYYFSPIKRGDVVIASGEEKNKVKPFVVKRVVGLPGETISFEGRDVFITSSNGEKKKIIEPYLNTQSTVRYNPLTTTLANDQYFLLGDNRGYSFDSRFAGPFNRDEIVARVFFRLLPFSHIGFIEHATIETT